MLRPTLRHTIPLAILTALLSGCKEDDQLQRSLQRQAEQIVGASRQLVEADAKARGELVELQQNLQEGVQTERQSLGRQHQELEAERQMIARQRHRDPLIAAAIVNTGVLLVSIAPMFLAFWVLRSSWSQESAGVGELLIHELTSGNPVFLPSPTLPLVSAEAAPGAAGALNGADFVSTDRDRRF
jgi:hypothetical protein